MPIAPATIALISVGLSAVGTGVSVYASMEQASAQEAAAKRSASIMRNNALTEMQRAQFEAERIRRRNLLIYGKQRAMMGAAGIEATGSAEDVIFDSQVQGELDAMAALYSGASSSNALRARATQYDLEASNASTLGTLSAVSHGMSGAGSILTGLGNYAAIREKTPQLD